MAGIQWNLLLLLFVSSIGMAKGDSGLRERISGAAEANEVRVKRADDVHASDLEVQQLAQRVTGQDAQITALQNQLTQLQADLQTARTEVGFYAYHVSSRFTLTGHGTLILDRTYTNTGSAFDTHSGTFTAPVSGMYAFYLTIRSYTDTIMYVDITLNGSSRTRAWVHHNNEQATAHVVLHLTQGNRVWPKNGSSTNRDVYGGTYTHFSGFLVQADP